MMLARSIRRPGTLSLFPSLAPKKGSTRGLRRLVTPPSPHEEALFQSLILEILHAQPSLRDSKTYLNSFGPRAIKQQQQQQQQTDGKQAKQRQPFPFQSSPSSSHLPHHAPPPPPPPTQGPITGRLFPPQVKSKRVNHQNISEQSTEENTAESSDSHTFAQPDVAHASSSTASIREQDLQGPVTTATQATLQESLSSMPVQQHTALVKVQGPFTSRQLESIAEGMVYLKRLGLVSVIVIDSEEPTWRSAVSHFTAHDGRRVQSESDSETDELAPWMTSTQLEGKTTSSMVGKGQEILRKRMLSDVTKLSELLAQKGAPARPFSHAIMRVDSSRVEQINELYPPSTSAERTNQQHYRWATAETPSVDRSPLVCDDSLSSLRRALASDMIPIIAPLALYEDPDGVEASRTVCVSADDVLVGLAREMAAEGREQSEMAEEGSSTEDVDMMPLRLMVINREGGIPSHARGGNPHLSINLASEYSHVVNSFIWDESNPTALNNLSMVRDCLAYMPKTSSGVVVSHRSPKSLIANLITNKAAHSPSLPHRLLAGRQDVRHTPTIIRPGLDIRVLQEYDQVDWVKMQRLLEASFRRRLNAEEYYARLQRSLDFVIVTGDYEGAAIVTHEYAPGEDPSTHESIAYLDKFAVLPSLQGSGAVDFLWGALRDEVHGLGLLDALNDNGGKGGFGKGKDLVWKSRSDNPVNRWYYERSNGFIQIDTTPRQPEDESPPAWAMFWCDAEERIATMSGERRLAAAATPDEVMDMARERASVRDLQRALLGEDEEEGEGKQGKQEKRNDTLYSPHVNADGRDLSQLHSGDGSQRLLPVIAPDEEGRLARWARCMSTIPTAWL